MLHTAGKDFVASALGDRSGSRAAAADYMALSTSATAPGAADTTRTGEITTAGGGLIRKQATYGHTGGASTYTLTATYTANGTDSLPATVQSVAVFNASSAGTMPWSSLLSPTATISASGDATTITETITIS
jgi:hypothetical protein